MRNPNERSWALAWAMASCLVLWRCLPVQALRLIRRMLAMAPDGLDAEHLQRFLWVGFDEVGVGQPTDVGLYDGR
jgi:hypothetical protein